VIAEMVMAWLFGHRVVARPWDLSHWRHNHRDAALLGIEVVES
jgi:hypothetical protein